MPIRLNAYPDSIKSLRAAFARAQAGTAATTIAARLIDGAIRFDASLVEKFNGESSFGVRRDPLNPPELELPDIAGMDWADDPHRMLEPGEQWNRGRRATMTGQAYALDAQGRPVNPYLNSGLRGRGILGRFGPNHAIDNGVLVIRTAAASSEDRLYVLCITRRDDPAKAPNLSGGFAKYMQKADGAYDLDSETLVRTQLEEFFEEMISGSVALLPEYAARVEPMIAEKLETIARHRGTQAMSVRQLAEIREQIKTELKMEQVQDLDPGFLQRLEAHIRGSIECFAGPVLYCRRASNTSWIESRLSWTLLDDATWDAIKGDNKFNYELVGGDDAENVHIYEFGPGLLNRALASHGPMMAFMAASFALHTQEKGQSLQPAIMRQLQSAADFMNSYGVQP